MSEAEEEGYELTVPFIVCASQGGPYDDAAFVAGVQYGRIYEQLAAGGWLLNEETVDSAIVPQLDLLAMRFGFTMKAVAWAEAPDEWTMVRFTRTRTEQDQAP